MAAAVVPVRTLGNLDARIVTKDSDGAYVVTDRYFTDDSLTIAASSVTADFRDHELSIDSTLRAVKEGAKWGVEGVVTDSQTGQILFEASLDTFQSDVALAFDPCGSSGAVACAGIAVAGGVAAAFCAATGISCVVASNIFTTAGATCGVATLLCFSILPVVPRSASCCGEDTRQVVEGRVDFGGLQPNGYVVKFNFNFYTPTNDIFACDPFGTVVDCLDPDVRTITMNIRADRTGQSTEYWEYRADAYKVIGGIFLCKERVLMETWARSAATSYQPQQHASGTAERARNTQYCSS